MHTKFGAKPAADWMFLIVLRNLASIVLKVFGYNFYKLKLHFSFPKTNQKCKMYKCYQLPCI